MPIDFIKKIRDKDNKWGKITKSRMNGFKEYLDKWDLIKEELLKERL
jgi:hypothetical protein